jgi:hypothetical protein
MLPQCSHITRKRGVYYYRRRLPQHPSRELALSLRTRCFREAEWLAAKLDKEFLVIMSSLKNDEKAADIQRIAREYLKDKLEADLLERRAQAGRVLTGWSKWFSSPEFADEELHKATADLAGSGNPGRHSDLIDWLMDQHGVPAGQRQELFFAILRAHVAEWETIRERTRGNFSFTPQDLVDKAVQSSTVVAIAEAPSPAPRLSEVLPGFLDFMSKHESWTGQTLAQNKTTYTMFVECCGDLPITAYERRHCATFHDVLLALPKLYAKSAAWRGLSLVEVVARTRDEDLCRRRP